MVTVSQRPVLLRNALRANGIFSFTSGLICMLGAGALAQYMEAGPPTLYLVVGIALMFHAATLWFFTQNHRINRGFAWYAIAGDILWVVATAVILITDAFAISTGGRWLILFIADIVLVFAIVQGIGLRRASQ